jgi:type IV pilus assembly protein PilC
LRPYLSQNDLALFARHFSAILASGMLPAKAIELLVKQTTDKTILTVLGLIVSDMQKGSNLAQAFSKQKRIFGTFFCSIISSGEASGNLKMLLAKVSEYYEKNDLFQKKIVRSLKYPLFIWVGTLGSLCTMLLYLIPAVMKKISHFSGTIPAPTAILFSLLHFLYFHLFLVIILSITLFAIVVALFLLCDVLEWVELILLKIPMYGNVRRKNSLRRFSLTLSFLLSNGLDFYNALKIAASTLNSRFLGNPNQVLQNTPKDIYSLLETLKNGELYPALIGEMLFDRNRNSANEEVLLTKIAEFYQEEVDVTLGAFFLVFGPATMTFLGLLGGGTLVALYMPFFKFVGNH